MNKALCILESKIYRWTIMFLAPQDKACFKLLAAAIVTWRCTLMAVPSVQMQSQLQSLNSSIIQKIWELKTALFKIIQDILLSYKPKIH